MLEPNRQVMEWLLHGYWEFPNPRDVLSGITPEQACERVADLPYSIGQLVAHMHWWQQRRLAITKGEEPGDFKPRVDDWPDVTPEQWAPLAEKLLASYDEILELVGDPAVMGRIVFGERNMGVMLVSHACHNAYHLGQIIVIRRLQGTWPEPDVSRSE